MEQPRRTLDGYGPNEMSIPEYRLLQKVGGDWAKEQGAIPGQFYNSILDEATDELNIIVVDILSGRSMWGSEITNAGPICFSLDVRNNKSVNGDDCSQCPYRLDTPWSVDATERRKKCCLNYTILGIDLDHDNTPVLIRAHGVSALPAKQLITQLRMNRSLKGEYHKAVINIKSQEKDTPYGSTYIMRPKLIRLISDEVEAEELRVESQRLLGAPIPLPEGRPEEENELEPFSYTQKESEPETPTEEVGEVEPINRLDVNEPQGNEEPPPETEQPVGKEPKEIDIDF